jgi:hypothetical protein
MEDFEFNQNLKFSSNSFKLAFNYFPNLLTIGPFNMVFEHLHDCFHLEDFVSGVLQLFQFCFHIAQGHIHQHIAHVLKIAHLLAMAKSFGGVYPIVLKETSYHIIRHNLCL